MLAMVRKAGAWVSRISAHGSNVDRRQHARSDAPADALHYMGNVAAIDSNYRSQLTREHWALFDAINSRDLGLATDLITRHIDEAASKVFARLAEPTPLDPH